MPRDSKKLAVIRTRWNPEKSGEFNDRLLRAEAAHEAVSGHAHAGEVGFTLATGYTICAGTLGIPMRCV